MTLPGEQPRRVARLPARAALARLDADRGVIENRRDALGQRDAGLARYGAELADQRLLARQPDQAVPNRPVGPGQPRRLAPMLDKGEQFSQAPPTNGR